jgi:hypothetical protein
MYELMSRKRRKRWLFYSDEWDEIYRITCDICGKTDNQKHLDYSYGFGAWPFGYMDYYGMKMVRVGYGNRNRRSIFVCRMHREEEIDKKIAEIE